MSRLDRLMAALGGAVVAAACAASTPPPSPERSPSPSLPSCITDADCAGGEQCIDGLCVRPAAREGEIDLPSCPGGCTDGSLCVDGICIGLVQPGVLADLCGCTEGWTCELERLRRRLPASGAALPDEPAQGDDAAN